MAGLSESVAEKVGKRLCSRTFILFLCAAVLCLTVKGCVLGGMAESPGLFRAVFNSQLAVGF